MDKIIFGILAIIPTTLLNLISMFITILFLVFIIYATIAAYIRNSRRKQERKVSEIKIKKLQKSSSDYKKILTKLEARHNSEQEAMQKKWQQQRKRK